MTKALHRKYSIGRDRLWLSTYFRQELLAQPFPAVSLQWIDAGMGWGVFAEKDFAPMEFIAEYTGVVRRRTKEDSKNSYCFEYLILPDEPTDYLIDAADRGNIARYINHKSSPNLSSAMIAYMDVSHIILYTSKPIKKGEELSYDYGEAFWSKRGPPR